MACTSLATEIMYQLEDSIGYSVGKHVSLKAGYAACLAPDRQRADRPDRNPHDAEGRHSGTGIFFLDRRG